MQLSAHPSPEEALAYWRQEASTNELYHRQVRWALVGLPVAAVVAAFHLLSGGLVAFTALLTYLLGTYMTVVRRFEFASNLREAQAELDAHRRGAAPSPAGLAGLAGSAPR